MKEVATDESMVAFCCAANQVSKHYENRNGAYLTLGLCMVYLQILLAKQPCYRGSVMNSRRLVRAEIIKQNQGF
ncbi:MAG: hypothetical protein DYG89_05720 [Caldilinea sp. CFX5]|nr:hypothetical protein [Caldilinea sp. CFX5]